MPAFDDQSVRRISRVVRRVEGIPSRRGGQSLTPSTSSLSFWAEITDEPSVGVYSWKLLVPDTDGTLIDASPAVTGTGNASAVNGEVGIPAGIRIRLWLVTYDGSGDPLYLFALEYAPPRFDARTGTPSQDGSNMRWTYPITEVVKSTAGYGGWTDRSGGRSGTAYSLMEDQHGTEESAGTYSDGVDQDNINAINDAGAGDGTFALQPIPSGTRVEVKEVYLPVTPYVEYWIVGIVNGVDGLCSTPA